MTDQTRRELSSRSELCSNPADFHASDAVLPSDGRGGGALAREKEGFGFGQDDRLH